MSAHTCHLPGCEKVVPPRLLFCPAHWKVVPTAIKREVLAAYQPGQEQRRVRPSASYLLAARRAIEAVQAIARDGKYTVTRTRLYGRQVP